MKFFINEFLNEISLNILVGNVQLSDEFLSTNWEKLNKEIITYYQLNMSEELILDKLDTINVDILVKEEKTSRNFLLKK